MITRYAVNVTIGDVIQIAQENTKLSNMCTMQISITSESLSAIRTSTAM